MNQMNKHFVIVEHDGWLIPANNSQLKYKELYEIPNNVEVRIYGIQGKEMDSHTGFMLLWQLNLSKGELGFHPGENKFYGMTVNYKTFKAGTNSSMISNYLLGKDSRIHTGLYSIPRNEMIPIYDIEDGYFMFLEDYIRENRLDQPEQGTTNVIHLICCQNFFYVK